MSDEVNVVVKGRKDTNEQLFTPSNGLAGYKEILSIERDVAPINFNAQQTSIDAGLDALPRSGKQRQAIYDLINRTLFGQRWGYTADEIQTITGLPIQSVSARISGLAKDGLIVDSGERRLTRNGRRAIAWLASN